MTPVDVSFCGQASRSAAGSAAGVGASPGSASITIGSARKGAPPATLANLARELAEAEMEGSLADQARRGRIPERGGAAIAEHDLIAVRSREQLTQPRRGSGRRGP